MDLYFQAMDWFNKGLTPDNLALAQIFFDRALTADPETPMRLLALPAWTRPAQYI